MIWVIWFLVCMSFILPLITIRGLEGVRKDMRKFESNSISFISPRGELNTAKKTIKTFQAILSVAIILLLADMVVIGVLTLIIQNKIIGG